MPQLFVPSAAGGSTAWVTNRFLWGPIQSLELGGSTTVDTLALSDADNSVAMVCMLDRDGTVDRVGLSISAKAGSSSAVLYNIGLVTVDATGFPTATAYGGSAIETRSVSALSTGWQWITLATPATAVAGQLAAVRIWPEGTTVPDGSNSVTVRRAYRVANQASVSLPYEANFQTAWAKAANQPMMSYRYSNGTVGMVPPLVSAVNSSSLNTGTTPDEVGGRFQVSWPSPCYGARIQVDVATLATNTFDVRLYDGASALIGTASVPAATLASAVFSRVDVWWDAVTLNANEDYRLTVLPTTTDSLTLAQVAVPDTDSKAAWACGDRFGLTTRTDAGAWTDTDTTVPLLGLWLGGPTG